MTTCEIGYMYRISLVCRQIELNLELEMQVIVVLFTATETCDLYRLC